MNDRIYFKIPDKCSVCGGPVYRSDSGTAITLMCGNPECEGKLINKIDHFAGKKGLDIKHLSKATLEKLIDLGWVNGPADLYTLKEHRSEWIQQPGFGVRSVDRILQSIEDSRTPTLESFICALGIPMIGRTASKDLLPYIKSYEDFVDKAKSKWDFSIIEGFGWEKCNAIWKYNYDEANAIRSYMLDITVSEPTAAKTNILSGLKFCITGRLLIIANREKLSNMIENNGGTVVNSISKNVNYLINNDINSNSSKNKQAISLNIPIISEREILDMIGEK